jgi:hypothetical protein
MTRPIISNEREALEEISTGRSKPTWMEGDAKLPFEHLTPDEFEVICFLLLKREWPSHDLVYYGKTGDAGRDIVVRDRGEVIKLYQCKHYSGSVGVDPVKAELAKLYCNVHSGAVPVRPSEVVFLVTTDLTAPANDLLDRRDDWQGHASAALRKHLKRDPEAELIELAHTWWPTFGREIGIELSLRIRYHSDLMSAFFSYQKVVTEELLEPIRTDLRQLRERPALDLRGSTFEVGGRGGSWGGGGGAGGVLVLHGWTPSAANRQVQIELDGKNGERYGAGGGGGGVVDYRGRPLTAEDLRLGFHVIAFMPSSRVEVKDGLLNIDGGGFSSWSSEAFPLVGMTVPFGVTIQSGQVAAGTRVVLELSASPLGGGRVFRKVRLYDVGDVQVDVMSGCVCVDIVVDVEEPGVWAFELSSGSHRLAQCRVEFRARPAEPGQV